jgi:dTDP-glucose pyrophosphorylase
MTDLSQNTVRDTAPITEAARALELAERKLVLVVDEAGRLVGTVSDGDIRRGLLRMIPITAPVTKVMNAAFVALRPGQDVRPVVQEMASKLIRHLPVVDEEGRVVDLEDIENPTRIAGRQNLVVIMAGGKGTRLAQLTQTCPKPMLKVGDKPLLETIIERFRAQGYHNFCISLNYLGDMISDYFGDGAGWDVNISYLRETEPRGTAGALSLIPGRPAEPMIVLNGDILTQMDFGALVAFHQEYRAAATVCLREYRFQVPYATVELEGPRIQRLLEKPIQSYLVNAGVYCLDPEVLDLVPDGGRVDMPDLLNALMREGHPVGSFPIHEYWLDIGQMQDFQTAQTDYERLFAGVAYD